MGGGSPVFVGEVADCLDVLGLFGGGFVEGEVDEEFLLVEVCAWDCFVVGEEELLGGGVGVVEEVFYGLAFGV